MSVCRPSLATILTGLYPHQHGVHFNHPPPGLSAMRKTSATEYHKTRAAAEHLVGDRPTIPRLLAQVGYVSFQAGKHWEGDYRNAGFTHGMTTGLPARTDDWTLGTRKQANGELVAHGNGDLGLAIGRQTMQPIAEFVDEFAGKKPFLVWYAPFLPHTPFDAGPEFHEPYADKDVPEHLEPYFAEIARFDASVGELVKIINDNDVVEDTVFIFASDNGFQPAENRHDRADSKSKLSVDEDGLRTPIVITWPGHVVAQRHDRLVQTIDLLPTILDLAECEELTPTRLPGFSLWPSATDTERLPNRPAFGAIYPNDATRLDDPPSHVRGRWVRSGDWKLIAAGDGPKKLTPALYNLREDPEEQNNLIIDLAAQEHRRRLTKLLNKWWMPNRKGPVQ